LAFDKKQVAGKADVMWMVLELLGICVCDTSHGLWLMVFAVAFCGTEAFKLSA